MMTDGDIAMILTNQGAILTALTLLLEMHPGYNEVACKVMEQAEKTADYILRMEAFNAKSL